MYLVLSSPLFLCVDVFVCACRLIGDALCAICSNPPPPPITRVGLTICVPVCSHGEKRGVVGVVVVVEVVVLIAVIGGCHDKDTHKNTKCLLNCMLT